MIQCFTYLEKHHAAYPSKHFSFAPLPQVLKSTKRLVCITLPHLHGQSLCNRSPGVATSSNAWCTLFLLAHGSYRLLAKGLILPTFGLTWRSSLLLRRVLSTQLESRVVMSAYPISSKFWRGHAHSSMYSNRSSSASSQVAKSGPNSRFTSLIVAVFRG